MFFSRNYYKEMQTSKRSLCTQLDLLALGQLGQLPSTKCLGQGQIKAADGCQQGATILGAQVVGKAYRSKLASMPAP